MTLNPKKAIVTGASGFVGSHMVDRLLSEGFDVVAYVRKSSNLRWLENKNIKLCIGSLEDPRPLIPHLKNCDYVFHIGGAIKHHRKITFYKTNTGATKDLAELCKLHAPGLKKFVFISTLEAGGPMPLGRVRTMKDPDQPQSHYGRSKYLAEEILKGYSQDLPVIIFRPPLVYGPRECGFFTFFKLNKHGIKLHIGHQKQAVSSIYINDLINALMLSIQPGLAGTFYISGQKSPDKWSAIHGTMIRLFKRKTARAIVIPKFIFLVYCTLSHVIETILDYSLPVNLYKYRSIVTNNWACDYETFAEKTGFLPAFSTEKGLAETYEWYVENKWLK